MAAIVAGTDYDYNNGVGTVAADLTQRVKSRRWLYLGLVGLGALVVWKKLF